MSPHRIAPHRIAIAALVAAAAVGGALACGWSQVRQTGAASNLRALAGILAIAAAAAMLDPHRAFPGWWAALPVAGAVLLLSAPKAWGCRHLLSSPPLVWVGLISYPLYLWHWPLLVFFAIIKFAPLTLLEYKTTVPATWVSRAMSFFQPTSRLAARSGPRFGFGVAVPKRVL